MGPAVHGPCPDCSSAHAVYGVVVLQMLNGTRDWAQLMVINASDPDGWAPGHTGSTGKRRTHNPWHLLQWTHVFKAAT